MGAGAGILSMTAVYPMYVVQNRLMVAKERLYTSIFDCIRKTYRAEGIRAFSQGYVPSFVRIIPYKGIDLAGYHILREQFVTPGEMPSKLQSLSSELPLLACLRPSRILFFLLVPSYSVKEMCGTSDQVQEHG